MPAPCRILYVDYSPDSHDLIGAMLKYSNLNHEIVAVDSPQQALALLKNRKFDLYIVDYFLPEISGIELCRSILRHDDRALVMFFTTLNHPRAQAEAYAAGAREYLVKPNDLDKLLKSVERLLSSGAQTACIINPQMAG